MGFSLSGAIKGAIGGGMSGGGWGALAGGVLGGFSGDGTSSAKNMYKWQLARNKEYDEWKMSNAHQLEAKDLEAAGLNPALTAGTSGASGVSSPLPGLSEGLATNKLQTEQINSALRAQEIFNNNNRIQAEIENIGADTETKLLDNKLIRKFGDKEKIADIANTIQDTMLMKANSAKITEEKNQLIQQQFLTRAQTAKTQNESANIALEMPKKAKVAQLYRDNPLGLGTIAAYGGELAPTINALTGAAGMVIGAKKFGQLSEGLESAIEHTYYDKNGEITGGTLVKRLPKKKRR